MPIENPLILGNNIFRERWVGFESPFYGYCFEAVADSRGWVLIFQDRLRMEGGPIMVLTNMILEDVFFD